MTICQHRTKVTEAPSKKEESLSGFPSSNYLIFA